MHQKEQEPGHRGKFSNAHLHIFRMRNSVLKEVEKSRFLVPAILCRNDFYTQLNDKAVRETDILKLLQNLNNPNLIKVKDIYEENDHLHFVMERANGMDLKKVIEERKKKNQRYTAPEILDFILQFCNGYSTLYEIKVFHRDIKADNVLTHSDQKTIYKVIDQFMKITDFGVSKILNNMQQQANHTRLGTKLYMSPQLLGGEQYSPLADVYSFGILLYQFTFFETPFDNSEKSIIEFQKKILKNPFIIDNLNIEGSVEQKKEIKDILEKTIVYQENRRITWADLIYRTKSNPVYYTKPQINSVNLFLKLQILKKRLAQLVIDNFEVAIQNNLFTIQPLLSNCYLTAIYAYQFNLIKNIDAIYQRNYNNLSVQLQSVTPMQQFGQQIDDFRNQLTQTDQQIISELYQSLNRISQINYLKNEAIQLIDCQKIKLLQFSQFRGNLEQLNQQTDYITFWRWVQYFEKSHLKKIILVKEDDLPQKPDCVVNFFAYSLMFNQVEQLYPQQNLLQMEKEENFPVLNMNREQILEKAMFYLWS